MFTLSRTISPVLGGVGVASFKLQHASSNAEIIDRYLNFVTSRMLQPSEKAAWVATFCNDSLVYHTLCFTVHTFQEILLENSPSLETYVHRGEMIRLARKRLRDPVLGNEKIGSLLLAVFTLWMINKGKEKPKAREGTLFVPHVPLDGTSYTAACVENDDVHVEAFSWLTGRVDGLGSIQNMPGLARGIAFGVALDASYHIKKPTLQVYPDLQAAIVNVPALVQAGRHRRSHRFSRSVPGGLPESALAVFDWIKHLDRVYQDGQLDRFWIRESLNIAQMRLLDLPAWEDLNAGERGCSSPAIYEVCRITTIIYSNAVLMSAGFNSPWVIKALTDLQNEIEILSLVKWEDMRIVPVLVWSLMIGTMTAWFSPFRAWFLRILREAVALARIERFEDVVGIAERFLWAECACGDGARVVWAAVTSEMEDGEMR